MLPTTSGFPTASRQPHDRRRAGLWRRYCGLAPRLDFIGQTASTQPTFVWYNFSDDNNPIEFQLYSYQPDGSFEAVTTERFETSQPGFMAYTLTAEDAIAVGETYLWPVVIYCDPEFEQPGQYTSADIEVVSLPSDLPTDLPEDAVERAMLFAQAGLWYEALAAVYDATTPEASDLREALLPELAAFEAQAEQFGAAALSEQLQEIAEQ
ncbi:MAG: DUF928 domain-containing protein [Leptolyngbyaceae cyanobacterium]